MSEARRVRFAPSPTGALHAGNMRTALFNWLTARATGGAFVLRIEDTDQERYVPGSEAQILESLRWLGLDWDEGPGVGGPRGPYVQSQRLDIYGPVAESVVRTGGAYWCTCTPERLARVRDAQRAAREPSRYDRHCLDRQDEVTAEREGGVPAVLRLRMPEGRTEWADVIRGSVAFDNATIDDQVLVKSDGFPTYHFAATVDDHLMGITHVIRAEDWLPSTPKHLALYGVLGWDPPVFAHVPNVLAPDGRLKLSKRRGAHDVLEYRVMGYLPAALVNAMALLGWSSGTEEEVFDQSDLVARFTLERVNPAPAIFDPRRLDALNGIHIRRLGDAALADALGPFVPGVERDALLRLAPLMRERMVRLTDAGDLVAPLMGDAVTDVPVPFPPPKVDRDTAAAILTAATEAWEGGADPDLDALRERIRAVSEGRGVKARDGFRVLYLAILGRPAGLPVLESMRFLGGDESLRRLRAALRRLEEEAPEPPSEGGAQ